MFEGSAIKSIWSIARSHTASLDNMDGIWKPFVTVQEAVDQIQDRQVNPDEGTALWAGEPTPSSLISIPHLKEINENIYEIHEPAGRPSVELVFFHGLQLDAGSSGEAHINTWTSRNNAECWLMWLLDDFPDARILIVSYDARARTTRRHGRMDMYVTCENLIHALTGDAARVGQDGCPVVLVGHCLGGLVMKELCCQAEQMIRLTHSKSVETFLDNIRGLFFFATPHHGSLIADSEKGSLNAPLMKGLKILKAETERRNNEFRILRKNKRWKTCGVVGLLPVTIKSFEGVVVPEASAGSDMDYFYADNVDHYNICRPVNKESRTFQLLSDFTRRFVTESQQASNDLELSDQSVQIDIPSGDAVTKDYPECSPWALLALKAVKLTVQFVHGLIAMAIYALRATFPREVSVESFHESDEITNNSTNMEVCFEAMKTVGKNSGVVFILEILIALSFYITPMACLSLVRFCMTGRSASRGQLEAELMSAPGCDQLFEMCILGFRSCWTRLSSQRVDPQVPSDDLEPGVQEEEEEAWMKL